jgi:hypothetical protein
MFFLVTNKAKQRTARSALEIIFRQGATIVRQTLSSPGGKINNAKILYRRDLDIWAYFGPPNAQINYIAFGVGKPTWRIGIAISIPIGRTLHSNGQLVEDEGGNLFLAHKGGLGGGVFSVKAEDFVILINGFVRSPVVDGDMTHELFVLASVKRSDDLRFLALYVKEAARIRELRKLASDAAYNKAIESLLQETEASSDENDEGGRVRSKKSRRIQATARDRAECARRGGQELGIPSPRPETAWWAKARSDCERKRSHPQPFV